MLKYLEGEAKDLVRGCIHLPTEECYKEARKLLDKHYGDPYRIISEYRKELRVWPKIKSHDPTAFRKFYSFLLKFKASMASSKFSQSYNNPELIQSLQLKLPPYLQERWNRLTYNIRSKGSHEADLEDFIQFIDQETTIVNDPNYSKSALGDMKNDEPSQSSFGKKRMKSMFTTTKNVSRCPHCEKAHDLDKCRDYLQLSVDERKKFLFKNRLCFCCYEATNKDHFAKTCKKRRKCEICREEHPTGLHGYQRSNVSRNVDHQARKETFSAYIDGEKGSIEKKSLVANCTKLIAEVISLSIVPVKITHPEYSTVVITNALLDNGSQGTFIHKELLKKLKAPSIPASISIKTMTGEETVSCKAIDNLEVSAIVEPAAKIKLPKTYSRSELPVDKEEIPTTERIKKWKYLNKIHQYLPQNEDNIEIGILIGGNCPRALEPLEMIPSQGNGPYAYRSLLGWCVTGPIYINSSSPHRNKCNYVAVERNGSRPVHFSIQNELKYQTIEEMMLAMFNQDFSENKDSLYDAEKMSQEDRRFLRLMEKEVKFVDGHYQLLLPLKDPDLKFPNNK